MKRSKQHWTKQKAAEIEFLATFSRRLGRGPSVADSPPTLAKTKLRAVRALKARRGCVASESNFAPFERTQTLDGWTFQYEYQRLNLTFDDVAGNQPYHGMDGLASLRSAFLLYTSSGQAATTTAILALKDVLERPSVEFQSTCYHETIDLLMHIGLPFRSIDARRGRSPILFIDSSVDSLPLDRKLLRRLPRFCIVDTTCWSLGSAELSSCVRSLLRRGSHVILVRSHIKLDCLGTELNRLGSLLCLPATNPKSHAELARFVDRANTYVTHMGCRAELGSLYPFLKSRKFRSLNDAWQRRLRASNARCVTLLETEARAAGRDLPIKKFPHQLFTYFLFPTLDEPTLRRAAETLIERLNEHEIPARTIASFPWDFVCVTVFVKRDLKFPKRPGIPTMRISIPDMADVDVDRCARVFSEWHRGLSP